MFANLYEIELDLYWNASNSFRCVVDWIRFISLIDFMRLPMVSIDMFESFLIWLNWIYYYFHIIMKFYPMNSIFLYLCLSVPTRPRVVSMALACLGGARCIFHDVRENTLRSCKVPHQDYNYTSVTLTRFDKISIMFL